jgi:hypothetical protein
MSAIERVSLGPAQAPESIMATTVKVYIGSPGEFSEEFDGQIRTFKVLPDGALWPMPKNYVLPHVYRTLNVIRYYTSIHNWIEEGIRFEEKSHALTT